MSPRLAADMPCAKRHHRQTLGEGEGVKGRSRLAGARSAALEALAQSIMSQPCVRTIEVSIAAVTARQTAGKQTTTRNG
jgi:hypothetical protein